MTRILGTEVNLSQWPWTDNWPDCGTKLIITGIHSADAYYESREEIIGLIATVVDPEGSCIKFSKEIHDPETNRLIPAGESVCFWNINVILLEDPDGNWA